MLMESLRKGKTKHKGVLIVVVLLLSVSLVGSFAVWSSPSGGGGSSGQSLDDIAAYKNQLAASIADSKAALTDQAGFAEYNSLADLCASLYTYAGYLAENDKDQDKVTSYRAEAQAAAADAATYYEKAYAAAPDELNELGRASLQSSAGQAYMQAGNSVKGGNLLKEAIAVLPTDYATNYYYSLYLLQSGRTQEAIDLLTAYRAAMADGDANADQVDQLISLYQGFLSEGNAEGSTEGNAEGNADGE